jgi:hypothetical protein
MQPEPLVRNYYQLPGWSRAPPRAPPNVGGGYPGNPETQPCVSKLVGPIHNSQWKESSVAKSNEPVGPTTSAPFSPSLAGADNRAGRAATFAIAAQARVSGPNLGARSCASKCVCVRVCFGRLCQGCAGAVLSDVAALSAGIRDRQLWMAQEFCFSSPPESIYDGAKAFYLPYIFGPRPSTKDSTCLRKIQS